VCLKHTAKCPKHTAKAFTVRCARQRVHGTVADDEDHLCRVPAAGHTAKPNACVFLALGTQKQRKHTAKAFTVRCAQQRLHGTVADDEDHICRVPAAGHTAKPNACVFLALGTQKQRNGHVRSNGQLCRAPRHRAHGKINYF